MLIGELARRTGTSERQLRYYERVGLLTAQRQANGYRSYDADAEQTVARIRALLDAGLSTRLIQHILPCAENDGVLRACPGVLAALRAQLDLLDHRADELARTRATLRTAITRMEDR
ncbi:MerR family transcriptional regulator [Nocardia pseudobrasiliensis]|uniref:DNA-binding transcriptional MerR regulator n=1 Tax=Nocardia pseudobrasiliensis TaxID=45979 RepID=A0A370IEE5_9NOCA|nr:MerR family transcriptional regulator [Nocardia pseudobrasiliensis]RDI69088.1 DNA-binding transcriptional MerR regulator [Nocardia pseudobrasiliensis]